MDEALLWHPVAALEELGAAPLAVRLLERALVLWRDASGALHAWTDRCPHRGTRLSMGRVTDGRLECAYHGWQFDADGQCIAIPALPDFTPPPTHKACAYPVRTAFGLAWVRLQESDQAVPAIDAVPERQVICGPFEVATSAPRVVENFLDTAHFGFVHEGWLGDRGHTGVPHYEVALGPGGAPSVPHYRAWQPKGAATAAGGAWVDYRYEVLGPYCAVLIKQADVSAAAKPAPREAYALWVCPVAPEECRVWFTQFTSDTSTPDETLRAFQTAIFTQDRPIIESQRPRRLPLGAGAELHCAADRMSVAYRRYLSQRGIEFGVC
ncbi:MAG TPA: aromatic ring-hydroxylating dioxygenase subunit alpha [Burkholderiaceae bacterium]|nr:aromatic ring-hydroxylating dioxygenase subunit alpha [Burkholderiaceae bacterium]